MKTLLFLCGLTIVAGNQLQWESFKLDHGKIYSNHKEDLYRRSVFESNLKYVEEHNNKFRQGLVTFDLAMNKFADLTSTEFVAQMTGMSNVEKRKSHVVAHFPEGKRNENVDWRDQGAVTPVRDQGMAGTCWPFSVVGPLESMWFLKTGDLIEESVQQLVDCVGIFENPYEYIRDNGGIDSEESYPYEGMASDCRFDPETVAATCTGYIDIPKGDEETQAKAVHDVGPVSVLVDASHLTFQLYSSGIYYEPECTSTILDHALVAIGYGTEGEDDYWLLKNSWGAVWGESGYMKITRNKDNHCGIASSSSYPTV